MRLGLGLSPQYAPAGDLGVGWVGGLGGGEGRGGRCAAAQGALYFGMTDGSVDQSMQAAGWRECVGAWEGS